MALFSRSRFEDLAIQLAGLKGRFILSLNDVQGVRETFKSFRFEKVKTTCPLRLRGVEFKNDRDQVGSQIGLWNAAKAWVLMWDMTTAAGWSPQRPTSFHRYRVVLLNGEKHSDGLLSSNPAFSVGGSLIRP